MSVSSTMQEEHKLMIVEQPVEHTVPCGQAADTRVGTCSRGLMVKLPAVGFMQDTYCTLCTSFKSSLLRSYLEVHTQTHKAKKIIIYQPCILRHSHTFLTLLLIGMPQLVFKPVWLSNIVLPLNFIPEILPAHL